MKRKTLLKLTACGLVGALTIGNFTVAAYAAPTAGVASLASDIATTSSARLQDFHWHSVKSQKKWKMRQPLQVHSRK